MSSYPSILPVDSASDYIIIFFIVTLILLSLFSLAFISYLCFRSRSSRHLHRFNSLWAVRFLLIFFITLWAINELLRVPYFRWLYLFPFLPRISVSQQSNLCQIYSALSLGLLEPGFLVTLLFLLKSSVQESTPKFSRALIFVFSSCIPLLSLQLLLIASFRFKYHLPEIFHLTSVVVKDSSGDETILCDFPLMGTFVFAAFAAVYSVLFMYSCSNLVSIVINKALRNRIWTLAAAVLAMLPVEIFFLGFSVLWAPGGNWFGYSALPIFLSTFILAAVGEGVLVIKPIADWLTAGGEFADDGWSRSSGLRIV